MVRDAGVSCCRRPVSRHQWATPSNSQDLARTQWRKPALVHALTCFCRQYARPLVVCPLGLEKELKAVLPAHVELTHWYAGDMAGANTYEDCDAVALIGHPRPPEDLIIQQVQALRWLDTWDDHPPAKGTPDPTAAVERPIPVEGFIDADGRGWARLGAAGHVCRGPRDL